MIQREFFNKVAGQDQAAAHNRQILTVAKSLAREHARLYGRCSIEDVRRLLSLKGYRFQSGTEKPNWMGSVFKGRDWETIGQEQAQHPGSHGRFVRIWRLRRER